MSFKKIVMCLALGMLSCSICNESFALGHKTRNTSPEVDGTRRVQIKKTPRIKEKLISKFGTKKMKEKLMDNYIEFAVDDNPAVTFMPGH